MLDEKKLKKIIATVLKVNIESVDDKASMDTIKSWDSLGHMNLILSIEEEFNVVIPDEEVGSITSYKLIALVVEELLQKS